MDIACSVDLADGVRASAGDAEQPEALLIAAIAASYGTSLYDILAAAALPQTGVSVCAHGATVLASGKTRLTRVTVDPAIRGADKARRDAYQRAAVTARDDCLVGRAIRGNVAYVVGEVSFPAG